MIGEPGTGAAGPDPDGSAQPDAASEQVRLVQDGFERFLSLTRLLALIPVLFLLLDAAASFIYGSDILVRSATGLIGEPAKVGGRLGVFLIVMDTFLVGATLMVSAFGFYELFIVRRPGPRYRLPSWLRMHDLEDLKARVVSMLVLVAAITFVDRTVESRDEQEVLFLGLGISIIIVALTFFLWFGRREVRAAGPESIVATGGGDDGGGGTTRRAGRTTRGGGGTPESGTGTDGRTVEAREGTGLRETTLTSAPRAAFRLATLKDVPVGDGPPATVRTRGGQPASDRHRRLAAILGFAWRNGDWASAEGTAFAVAGYARVDLRDADFSGPEVSIRANAVLGVISVVVPPGTSVAESGVAVLGLRLSRRAAASPETGQRHRLELSGLCVLGIVRVQCQPATRTLGKVTTGSRWPADRVVGE